MIENDYNSGQKQYDEALLSAWHKLSGGFPIVLPAYVVAAVKRLQECEVREVKKKLYENTN